MLHCEKAVIISGEEEEGLGAGAEGFGGAPFAGLLGEGAGAVKFFVVGEECWVGGIVAAFVGLDAVEVADGQPLIWCDGGEAEDG